MATDMFGNILSPEEEERQRRHAEAMGLLPPALRVQMTAPFGGGIGPQLNQYQGMTGFPRVPHHSQPGGYFEQNITPIPTDITVDPTMAGMAGVTQDYGPFSPSLGVLSGMLAPAPSSSLPSYFDDPAVNEDMERLVAEEAATKVDDFAMLASQDPVASLGGWIKDVTKTVELPDIVEKKQPYTSPMPILPMDNVVPQTGITPIRFTTGADASVPDVSVAPSMQGVDYSQALADIGVNPATSGMATVPTVLPGRTPQKADEAIDKGTFDAIEHIDAIYGGIPSQISVKDPFARTIGKIAAGFLSDDTIMDIMTTGIPYTGFTGDDITTATTAESIKDVINNIVIMDAKKGGIPKDDLIASVVSGVNPLIQTSDAALTAAADYVSQGGKIDIDDAREMAFQQDTFKDIPAVRPSTPTTQVSKNRRAAAKAKRDKAKAALAQQRKADLAAQKAAARRTKLARQALKDSQAAAAAAQAASAAQAKAAQKAAKAVLSRLGQDRNRPSDREVAAAIEVMSQVDSFGSGGQRGFMGADIGREDGGGFTGGDFSGGAGWE